ncbi:MAG: hypothetical protein JSV42_14625 [Chloroflexota bacterium]|nr:MAG: hypothetical protein JSV42_14625 [Chloroflexota bacterium]
MKKIFALTIIVWLVMFPSASAVSAANRASQIVANIHQRLGRLWVATCTYELPAVTGIEGEHA